jgi:hypothetical protein
VFRRARAIVDGCDAIVTEVNLVPLYAGGMGRIAAAQIQISDSTRVAQSRQHSKTSSNC